MVRRLSTEELILESFRELAQSKPIDEISVQDVVDNCGVSKRTFYNYFQSKDDLLLKEQQTAQPQISAQLSAEDIKNHWVQESLRYRAIGDLSDNVAREMRNNPAIHNGLVESTITHLTGTIEAKAGKDAITPEVEFAMWFWAEAAMHAQERQGSGHIPVPVETWVQWEFNCLPDVLKRLLGE